MHGVKTKICKQKFHMTHSVETTTPPPQQCYVQAHPIISCHLFVNREDSVIGHSYYYGHINFSCVICYIFPSTAYTSSIQFLHPLSYLTLCT